MKPHFTAVGRLARRDGGLKQSGQLGPLVTRKADKEGSYVRIKFSYNIPVCGPFDGELIIDKSNNGQYHIHGH